MRRVIILHVKLGKDTWSTIIGFVSLGALIAGTLMLGTLSSEAALTLSGATGLTFKSNNDAFDGASSDAWVVYRGRLYQLTTYAHDDALLKRLLASWTFF